MAVLSPLLAGALLSLSPNPSFAAASAASFAFQPGSRQCEETPARTTRRGILGGISNAIGGRLMGSNRVTQTIGSYLPAQQMLTDALINLLDCDEQQKASRATEEATVQAERSGAGTSVAWESESRPGVSGRSTVTAVDAAGTGGQRCMTVTDVVIVDGEETTMPKRMCRTPPSTRYARV